MKPDICPYCDKPALYAPEDRCRACNAPVSLHAPNVQIAKAERHALDRRYEQARNRAKARGCSELFCKLEKIAAQSTAVFTAGSLSAFHLLTSDRLRISSYRTLISPTLRAPELSKSYRQTRVVESWLFGEYADRIVYAALSFDGTGLPAYGSIHMTLDEKTIAHRASVLEESSITFASRHEVAPSSRPMGYVSTWSDRGRLAAAKLEPILDRKLEEQDLPGLLLKPRGISPAEFLEVHIYGSFNWQAVSSIRVTLSESSRIPLLEQTILKALEDEARKKGIDWRSGSENVST